MAKKMDRNISKNIKHGFNKNEEKVINKNINKSNKIIILVISAILIVALGTSSWVAYSKYMSQIKGNISIENANIICEMTVTPSENSNLIYNPYCTVVIKNFNEKGDVTKTNLRYTINVVSKNGTSVPSYYWKDSNGQVVVQNSTLEGNFTIDGQQSKQYTIFFINSGEQISTENLEFNLVAVQE